MSASDTLATELTKADPLPVEDSLDSCAGPASVTQVKVLGIEVIIDFASLGRSIWMVRSPGIQQLTSCAWLLNAEVSAPRAALKGPKASSVKLVNYG